MSYQGLTIRTVKGSALSTLEEDASKALKLTQTSHGFSPGDLVYPDSATTWAKADGSAIASVAEGIVVSVPDANTAWIVTTDGSLLTLTGHGLGSAGGRLWLDQSTAGAITSTQPVVGVIQPVGRVVDDDTIIFRLGALQEV